MQYLIQAVSVNEDIQFNKYGDNKVMICHLDAVAGLLVDDRDVAPAELLNDLHHRLNLVQVAGDGACEVLKPRLVR